MLLFRYFMFISKIEEIELAHFEIADRLSPMEVTRQGSWFLPLN
jgi:hypothetical protein